MRCVCVHRAEANGECLSLNDLVAMETTDATHKGGRGATTTGMKADKRADVCV